MRNRKHFTTILASTRQPYCYVLVTPPCKDYFDKQNIAVSSTAMTVFFQHDSFGILLAQNFVHWGLAGAKLQDVFFASKDF